eukprot:TRINITY_DN27732_c0_g1_i1.p1 TRINITY_DN27732_c0_g1~~TRINITY_DN27732_c0_g1_i1.p1  ORF type:complete len:675 (+),score=229.29 TRINITY_DN27732_c0_g1_i1:66-2090(+)
MQAAMMARLLLFFAALMPSLGVRLQVRKAAANPVSKVVNLLNDLAKKAEKDGEKEKKLYDKFVCMGKTSIKEKEDFMSESVQRISFLESTVAQIDANNASAVQQESKLVEEIANMEADVNETAKTRGAQVAAAQAQVNETQEGIDGLTTAINSLSGNAGLLSVGTDAGKKTADFKEALRLGEKYLSKANSFFLRSILTGHVATPALVQVASPAEERASGIVKTLSGIKKQFSASLEKAKKEAEDALKLYSELKESKAEQLQSAKDALSKLRLVQAERIRAQADAKAEMEELKKKIVAEKEFVDDFQKGLGEKEKEFDERTTLRQEELSAISEAIAILQSDEARDVFRKTGTLLQIASDQANEQRRTAAQLLLAAGTHDARVLDIAKLLTASSNSSFGNVLEKIDTMKSVLEQEQENDLKKREECKDTLAKDKTSLSSKEGVVEDLSLSQESLEREVDTAADRMEKQESEIEDIKKELEKSQELRNSEHKEYLEAQQNDKLALSLLAEATKKVSDFYTKDGASLIQDKSKRLSLTHGVAQSLDFGSSHTSKGTGVVQTMEMVAADVEKDIALADKEEAAALALFEENKKSLEEQKEQLEAMKTTMKGQQSSTAQDLTQAKASLRTAKDSLAAIKAKMEGSKKGCDTILTDFDKRQKNRQDEIDGLLKAKTALAKA